MLKLQYLFIISLLVVSVPGAFASSINSTINTPDQGFSFSTAQNRTDNLAYSEQNIQSWNSIINVETPNIQPIFFPILIMIIFSVSLAVGIKSKETAIGGMFFVLAFLMSIVLILIFSGNLEYGIIEENLKSEINTSTGLIEISKTYNTNKIIPNDETFRPIFTLVFQLLFFFSMIVFVTKLFLMPMLEKRKEEKKKLEN